MSSEHHQAAEVNQTFPVGDFECFIVSDGSFAYPNPGQSFFANADQDELTTALECHGIDTETWEMYVSPYPCLIVQTDDHTVLVDTGGGELGDHTGKLQPNLDTVGINPMDIDVVLLTHIHPDHVGGNITDNGDPAFPNAQYLVPDAEYEFWLHGPDLSSLQLPDHIKEAMITFAEEQVRPLDDELDRLPDESTEIVPGIQTIPAPGHTPGHVAVEVQSADETLLHLVDLVFFPVHIEHPEWYAAFDLDPDTLVDSRRHLLTRASEEKSLVMAHHFSPPGLGQIHATETRYEWEPLSSMTE
jgi:glyoxylase-like metal-dependent hydrolase (beta-lactamase superfamily II)